MLKQKTSIILLAFSLLSGQFGCGGNSPFGGGQSDGGGNAPATRRAPHYEPGFNLFKPEQDIELGRRSAEEIVRQAPLLRDAAIVNYVQQLGAKLAARAGGFRFPYQFNVVASREINAFALPGGFIFVNAGAIAAAKNEGELAGVIAHEIVHVALRHGTNQASKAYIAKAGIGIISSVLGGGENADINSVINTVGGTGANMLFLKFGRTAETQADLEGARIMAEAGYDPRDMAAFFQTLQQRAGQRTPEFLSDHPDPGNRIAAINRELPSLPVSSNPIRNTNEFQSAQARLGGRNASAVQSSKDVARTGPREPEEIKGNRPPAPSTNLRSFQSPDGSFALQIPDNWDALQADEANYIFAPKGAYGETQQGVVVTHGIFAGTVAAQSSDLEMANNQFIRSQIEANPDFRVARQPQQIDFGGRAGYATVVAGLSTVTGTMEVDVIYTTASSDGRLFYVVTMAPEAEIESYENAFRQTLGSIRLAR